MGCGGDVGWTHSWIESTTSMSGDLGFRLLRHVCGLIDNLEYACEFVREIELGGNAFGKKI